MYGAQLRHNTNSTGCHAGEPGQPVSICATRNHPTHTHSTERHILNLTQLAGNLSAASDRIQHHAEHAREDEIADD